MDGVHSGWCPFGIVSIWDGVHSGWCLFGIVSIRDCVHSGLCPFEIVSVGDFVHSGLCPFGIVSIRDCVHSGWCPFEIIFFGIVYRIRFKELAEEIVKIRRKGDRDPDLQVVALTKKLIGMLKFLFLNLFIVVA